MSNADKKFSLMRQCMCGELDVRLPHETRHGLGRHTSTIVEDLAGHAIALALVDPTALTHGNTGSILSTLFLELAIRCSVFCTECVVFEDRDGRATNMLQEVYGFV